MVFASIALGGHFVWGTLFTDNVSTFGQEYVKVRPSSIATLVHVVASHQHLWGQDWWLFSILKLESSLHHLGKRNSVARPTSRLISVLASKIKSINISEVIGIWNLIILDILSIIVFLGPTLCLFESVFEFLVVQVTKFILSTTISFNKVFFIIDLGQAESLAVLAIQRMVLLVFAGICFPAEVGIINFTNQNVHFIAGFVLQMQVSSL